MNTHLQAIDVGAMQTREARRANTDAIPAKSSLWAGRVLSGLPVLFLIFDSVVKFTPLPAVAEAHTRLGFPTELASVLGIVLLVSTLLYAYPRTAVLGAILLTGYLGGATATHVRVADPFWFPILVGMMLWGGLYLRDERIRTLLPIRG